MSIDFKRVIEQAEGYRPQISAFLRDMVAIPSESCDEEKVIQRIKQEMQAVGFDRVEIDPMGNVLGYIGSGKHLIAMDAHIDTVGIGNRDNWEHDPYTGYENDEVIYGRGGSDQEGGMASMVYAGKIIKDLGLENDYTLLVTGTVQEEDCDGLCWQYIVNEDGLRPDLLVSREPARLHIYGGQRGRMEMEVHTSGVSCHGSAPERGVNAIYKMAGIIADIEKLNERLEPRDPLGKGTVTISEIRSTSPSLCAVADGCTIHLDRRLTIGETEATSVAEIEALPSVQAAGATVSVLEYSVPSYTGLEYPTRKYYPTWETPADAPGTLAAVAAQFQGVRVHYTE